MKKNYFIIFASMIFLCVSCNDDNKLKDGYQGWDQLPVYNSFAQDELAVTVDQTQALQKVSIPFYAELKDGTQGFGRMSSVAVNVVADGTTAIEGVHYILEQSGNDTWTKAIDANYLLDSKTFVTQFVVLPKNIKSEVTLVLATDAGEIVPSQSAKSETTRRPKIEKITVTLKPMI